MVEETLADIAVKKIMYTAMLSNSASFNVYAYIFKEDGNLTAGNETASVSPGIVFCVLQKETGRTCVCETAIFRKCDLDI